MNKRVIIGVDPGVKTGIATFCDGRLTSLETSNWFDEFFHSQASNWLDEVFYFGKLHVALQEKVAVVMEDSRLQSHIFTAPSVKGAAKLKIARNVGQLDMICAYILIALPLLAALCIA
jgi:hypothetical protein